MMIHENIGKLSESESSSILRGIPASKGISIGKAFLLSSEPILASDHTIKPEEIALEKEKVETALKNLIAECDLLLEKVQNEPGAVGSIIESNKMIISDPFLKESIFNLIDSLVSAETAVIMEFDRNKKFFIDSNDAILRERANDFDNIKLRLVSAMRKRSNLIDIPKNSIIVSPLLTTTDIVNFKEAGILAFVTEVGGVASHSSILARSFAIPSVIGLKEATSKIKTGDLLVIDGFSGTVYINPNEEALNKCRTLIAEIEEHKRQLGKLVSEPAETIDGTRIALLSNIDLMEDSNEAMLNGAEGFGLVRTENMILSAKQIPSEEEQFAWYKQLADKAYPYPVSIRAFDFGSDKFAEGLPKHEDNPALGFRGIRFLLSRKDVFISQIMAVLKASKNKNVKFLLPMISNVNEVQHSLEIIEMCKNRLEKNGIDFDKNMPVGVMIETPAAVIIADKLAEITQFFSIGTNDLAQYTTGADRNNELVANVYDAFHPAVIRMIKSTLDAANQNNISVSICGELAGHSASTPLLIGLGVKELSVAPSLLLETKSRIRSTNHKNSLIIAKKALSSSTHEEIRIVLELNN